MCIGELYRKAQQPKLFSNNSKMQIAGTMADRSVDALQALTWLHRMVNPKFALASQQLRPLNQQLVSS